MNFAAQLMLGVIVVAGLIAGALMVFTALASHRAESAVPPDTRVSPPPGE